MNDPASSFHSRAAGGVTPAELFAQLQHRAPGAGVAALAAAAVAPPEVLAPADLFAALLLVASDNICFKDTDGRYVAVSEHMARTCGLPLAAPMIGRTDFDYFDRDHAASAFAHEQNIQRTGETLSDLEEKQVWPDGSVTWISTSRFPLRNPAGQIVGTFGISRDITARKLAEEKLALTQQELIAVARQNAVSEYAGAIISQISALSEAITATITSTQTHADSSKLLRELRATLAAATSELAPASALVDRLQQEQARVVGDLEELQQCAEQLRRVLQMAG